jgi:hypothetical protein
LDFERRGFYRVDHLEWGNDLHLRNAMNLGWLWDERDRSWLHSCLFFWFLACSPPFSHEVHRSICQHRQQDIVWVWRDKWKITTSTVFILCVCVCMCVCVCYVYYIKHNFKFHEG